MSSILSTRTGSPSPMKVSVPAAAPVGLFDTGMSAKEPSLKAVTAAEIERVVKTRMALHLMKSLHYIGSEG